MDAQSQSGINFSHLMSGYDLMGSAGKHWMEAVNRIFTKSTNTTENNIMPFNMWQSWYENAVGRKPGQMMDMQALTNACLENQKKCSEIGLAWCHYAVKTMQAVRAGMENGDSPAKIMKDCIDCSTDYARHCADFMLKWSEEWSRFIGSFQTAGAEKSAAETKTAKAKAA